MNRNERELWRRIERLESQLRRIQGRVARHPMISTAFSGGCHCVEGSITACSVCVNAPDEWVAVIGSGWAESAAVAGEHTLEHSANCVWESAAVTVSGSDYIWRLTITSTTDVVLELVLDSGGGGLSLPTFELMTGIVWRCECQNDLVLTNYGDISNPANLPMIVRLTPNEP